MRDKSEAHSFLSSLENRLRSTLCASTEMRPRISEIMKVAAVDPAKKHWGNNPEAAFLNALVAPLLFEHMQTVPGIGQSEARQSLVSDYWHSMPEFCSQSSARTEHYLFGKQLGGEFASEIMARWKGQRGKILRQPYPDFAFRRPFPHKILIEGKYFSGGNAERSLVEALHETCFYRGLPFVPEAPPKPAWDYDFGCLIAYDASESGDLLSAWNSVIPKAKFWESASVYVMVLGGERVGDAVKSATAEIASEGKQIRRTKSEEVIDSPGELVTIHIPGARESATAIITPPLGGRERWFDKRRGISCRPHPDGGLVVTMPIIELERRGLSHLVAAKS